jgi:hypothetical protein
MPETGQVFHLWQRAHFFNALSHLVFLTLHDKHEFGARDGGVCGGVEDIMGVRRIEPAATVCRLEDGEVSETNVWDGHVTQAILSTSCC